MTDFSVLEQELSLHGMELSGRQKEQFSTFYEAMVEKNKVMNLTTITEPDAVMLRHFCDSLTVLRAVELKDKVSLIDVGTGAGFPGIPLKICFPELKVTLIDSLQKRLRFLEEVRDALGLKDLELVHGRAEELGRRQDLREQFDVCASRAVSQLNVLAEYCLPFVKTGGVFVSYKSADCEEEVRAAGKAVAILGGEIRETLRFSLPGSDIGRALVIIEKKKPIGKKYPRKAGTPAKEPLGLSDPNL